MIKIPPNTYICQIMEEMDVALVTFVPQSHVPQFKSLGKWIARESSYPDEFVSGITMVSSRSLVDVRHVDIKYDFTYQNKKEWITVPTGLFCLTGSIAGSCGRLYVDNSGKNPRPIVAMHVAGSPTCSFGTLISTDLITFLASAGMEIQEGEDEEQESNFVHEPEIDINIINSVEGNKVLSVVPDELRCRVNPNSNLEPSIIFDDSVNTTVPALLGTKINPDGKVVKPFEQALIKKLAPRHIFEDSDFNRVVEIFIDAMPKLINPRKLTQDEAINGVRYSNLIRPIELKTSAGYPHTTPAGKKALNLTENGKRDFFTMDENGKRYPTEKFDICYEAAYNEAMTTGKRTLVIQDCLKDETLKPAKVFEIIDGQHFWIGKTRIMGPVPVEDLIIERELFGTFYMNILKWREEMGFCDVGINPHSMDIDLMIRNIMPTSNPDDIVVIDGDISGLDGGIKESLCLAFEKIVESYYSEVDDDDFAHMRDVYHRALARECTHIVGNVMYQTCSNPSGRFLTTVFNSCITMLGIMLAAYKKTKDAAFTASLLTKARVYGDDHIIMFHKDNAPFDMFDMFEAFKVMGLKYTSINKDAELTAFDTFENCKYLSRYFVKDEFGRYHAALDKKTLETIGQWKPKSISNQTFIEAIVQSMMFEAFHWGPAYFADRKRYVHKLLDQIHFPFKFFYSYTDLYSNFLDITPNRGVVNINVENLHAQSGHAQNPSFISNGFLQQRQKRRQVRNQIRQQFVQIQNDIRDLQERETDLGSARR